MAGKEILEVLKKSREVELSVKGRVSGRMIPRPVWFVISKDEKSVLFIPVNGRKTQWYLNVKKEPMVTVRAGNRAFTATMSEMEPDQFDEALRAFTARYGERAMKDYYPNLEVALQVQLPVRS